MERACDSMDLRINVGKSKVLMVKKDQMGNCEKVRVNWELMQEVDKFNYLGVMINTGGGIGEERYKDDGIAVEWEHDVQRSKTGAAGKS